MDNILFVVIIIMGVISGWFLDDVLLSPFVQRKKVLYCLMNCFVYVLLFYKNGMQTETLIYCLMASFLLIISIIDYHFYEIPVKFNYFLLFLGIVYSCLDYKNLISHIGGFFCVSFFLLLLFLMSNGKLMGGGDVKLMAVCGLILGWKKILFAFYLGCVLAAAAYYLRIIRRNNRKEIAMGPWFTIGILLILLQPLR